MDYNIMKIDELLSNLIDNVSQSQLDKELKCFKLYARKLGIRDYAELWVAVSEEDPSFIFQDGIMIPSLYKDREVYLYPSAKIITEKFNNNIYIYALNEESIKNVFETMDKFLDMPVEDFFTQSNSNEYEDEGEEASNKSFIDIEECLKLRDKLSNNRYALQTKYLSERYTEDQKLKIASMLNENVGDEELYNYMQELHNDEEAMKNYYGIENSSIRDPYTAAKTDVDRDIKNGTVIDFDPDNREEVIQSLMNKEGWDEDQANDYFTYYWEFYEDYLEDTYIVDDEFDWSVDD